MSRISILAPSPIRGSGGVGRIYTFAKALNEAGHQCDVYTFDSNGRQASELKKDARSFYGIDNLHIVSGIKLDKDYDLIIATRWDTAQIVRDMPAGKRAYLIQDFEACFNLVGDGTILAENTYLYGLQSITYGRWLALKLHSEFGNTPYYCNFATDLTKFKVIQPLAERIDQPPAICFIYQHDKPRRCPNLGIEALGIVKHLRPDVQIYFVGSDQSPALWYDYTNVGLLSMEGLNDLYNRCHVGLCLSSSNPSCNAFDMMAAGLPSVDLYRENNLFDIPGDGVMLAHQTPESLAEAMLYLISNRQALLKRSDFGVQFMQSRSAVNEAIEFLAAVNGILEGTPSNFDVQEIVGQRFISEAVIAPAYRNPSVIQHVNSQLNKYTSLVDRAGDAENLHKPTLKSHSFVTSINQSSNCHVPPSNAFRARLKRLIKRVIGVA